MHGTVNHNKSDIIEVFENYKILDYVNRGYYEILICLQLLTNALDSCEGSVFFQTIDRILMSFTVFPLIYTFLVLSANIPPPYFFKFGTGAGDEKIDIKSMSGEVDIINKTLSPSFLVHGHGYTNLHVSKVQSMTLSYVSQCLRAITWCDSENCNPSHEFID